MSTNMYGLSFAFCGLMVEVGSITWSKPPIWATGSWTAMPRQLPSAWVTSTSPGTLDIRMSLMPTMYFTAALLLCSRHFPVNRRFNVTETVAQPQQALRMSHEQYAIGGQNIPKPVDQLPLRRPYRSRSSRSGKRLHRRGLSWARGP